MNRPSETVSGPRQPPPVSGVWTEGGRTLAAIPRQAWETDFAVTLRTTPLRQPTIDGIAQEESWQSAPLRWRRRGDSLVLLEYRRSAGGIISYERRAVFPVLRWDVDNTAVIDAAELLTHLQREAAPPPPRSAMAFTAEDTTASPAVPAGLPRVPAPHIRTHLQTVSPLGKGTFRVLGQEGPVPVSQRWSFFALPQPPMRPRIGDPRITSHLSDKYVQRWRLEKKDPTAAASDVTQPIIYRLDTETIPRRLLPWVRRGIEEWTPIFDSLGFRHVIVIREQPYSAERNEAGAAPGCWIGWGYSAQTGPMAPEGGATTLDEVDPRTGEIVRCSIRIDSAVFSSHLEPTYFLEAGVSPALPRYPLPDSLVGPLVQFVIAHEVGHSFGFGHNFRAGTVYPTDSLRRLSFLRRYGHTGSVLSYAWLNSVAQPEDHVPPAELLMHVGPYDRWAMHYQYAPIPDAKTPEEELPTLERWRAAQDTAPYLQVGLPARSGLDDSRMAVGADPVTAAGYALENLARAVPRIDSQAAVDPALSAALRETFLTGAFGSWSQWLTRVANVVGGVGVTGPLARDLAQTPVAPIDSAHQVEAFRFVLTHLFRAQDPVLRALVGPAPPDTALVLFGTTTSGWPAGQLQQAQEAVFGTMVSSERLGRVAAQSKTTHVLPVVCAELTALNDALTKAGAVTRNAEERAHVDRLLQILGPLVDPTFGTCNPDGLQPGGTAP